MPFAGAFLFYYSSATSYHSHGSTGKQTSCMPRLSVAATSDSTTFIYVVQLQKVSPCTISCLSVRIGKFATGLLSNASSTIKRVEDSYRSFFNYVMYLHIHTKREYYHFNDTVVKRCSLSSRHPISEVKNSLISMLLSKLARATVILITIGDGRRHRWSNKLPIRR